MRGKKRVSLAILLILIVSLSISVVVFADVRIKFSGTQTMATNTSRRIYVSGAGSRRVSVTSSSGSVSVRKDATSYIVTGKKAGSSYVTVTVGSIRRRIHTVVLSDNQIKERVLARARKYYGNKARLFESECFRSKDGKTYNVTLVKPQGDGAPLLRVKVNLSTGRAVCGSGWMEFFRKMPKSFLIWSN